MLTILVLVLLGLCFGSFVNALVWRLHEHKDFVSDRSVCVHCGHVLGASDLIPVLSWLYLRGKCRYCKKSIAVQYPLVELATAGLFVVSYFLWPESLSNGQWVLFGLWLVLLIGFMALTVYDLRWMLLPNKLMFPMTFVAALYAVVSVVLAEKPFQSLLAVLGSVAIGGGIFYLIFQVSKGKWIGGGDVKLGFLLGFIAGTPVRMLLVIFLASLLGSVVSIPLLMSRKLNRSAVVPFGPFLIAGMILVQLYGTQIILWYQNTFLTISV